jgi:soluble lytic murein transglycosylase-like protein
MLCSAGIHRVAPGYGRGGTARKKWAKRAGLWLWAIGVLLCVALAWATVRQREFDRARIPQSGASPVRTAAAAPGRAAARAKIAGVVLRYTVRWGDTLSGIAAEYGTDGPTLVSLNHLPADGSVQTGQRLVIPVERASETADAATGANEGAVATLLTKEARAAGLDPALLKAVAWQESGWQMEAYSPAGAIGLMQLMPDTADWVGSALLGRALNPQNMRDNVEGGAALLKYDLGLFGDTWTALAAYNEGATAVLTEGVSGDAASYASQVLALSAQFRD